MCNMGVILKKRLSLIYSNCQTVQCVSGVVVSVLGWRQFVAGSSLAPYVVAPLALESGLELHHLMQLDGRPSS